MLYVDSAGSLLAVGLMHAAFNASGALGAVRGAWQYPPAMVLLAPTIVLRGLPGPTV